MLTKDLHEQGMVAAQNAATAYLNDYPDNWFPCGFASVTAYVKGNSKMGKSFIAQGFRKSYSGGYTLYNPSSLGTQVMEAKLAGARAYAKLINAELGEGTVTASSRMD